MRKRMGCSPWLLVCSLLAWTNACTPMYRVLVENTVEEGLMRIGTIRKILQDVDSSTMDTVTLTKQTLQDIFYPQPDNGYLWHNNTKKKKGITDTECVASLNTVWSYVTGGSGVSSLETLVDLADLTEEEFKTNYLGSNKLAGITDITFPERNYLADIPYIPLPGSFVWRVQADGSWKFECQHGEKECLGNILEVCIMQQLNWDSDMYLPVISCMEGSDDPVSSAKGCVRDLSSLSYDAVKNCAAGKEGNKLEHSMGAKTESLDPPHKYVPWVVVNGEHTDELQEKAQSDLLGLVCSLYQGAQPAECNTGETVLGGGEIQLDWA